MLTSCSLFQTLFGEPINQRWQEEKIFSEDVRLFLASPPVTGIGETPDFHHTEPDVEEE